MKKLGLLTTLAIIILLFSFIALAANPDWMAIEAGCNPPPELQRRFESEIGFIRKSILDTSNNLDKLKNIKVEFSCSSNALSIAGFFDRRNGEKKIIFGAGFLETSERLGDAMALTLLTGKQLYESYPKYLAQSIISKQKIESIKWPNDFIELTDQELKNFNTDIMKAQRKGFYLGVLTFALGHEYGHFLYDHFEKGIRTKMDFPKSSDDAIIFQRQEYECDRFASQCLSNIGQYPLVGIILNQFLFEVERIVSDKRYFQSHPPALARSSFIVDDAIRYIQERTHDTQEKKQKDIKSFQRIQIDLNEKIYNNLGPSRLRLGIPDSQFNSCLENYDNRCMNSCQNYYNLSEIKCREKCSKAQQEKSNMTRCYLNIAWQN